MTIYDDIINEIDMIYESTFINENTNTTKSTDAYNCISYANKELTKNSNVNESTDCNDFYYRFEYNGVGIYEALKNNISNEEWKCILDSGVLGWLPKPKFYGKNNRSYFTEIGYRMFMKTTYPLIIRYLDDKKIKMSKYQISDNDIVYKDRYQIITR